MSVIHEALKKIGEPTLKQPRIVPVKRKESPPTHKFFTPFWMLVVLMGTGSFFAGQIFGAGPGATVPRAPGALGQFAVEEIPVAPPSPTFFPSARPAKREAFVLSGIVQTDSGSYCLINGMVLRQGQKIGGATVESIAQDTVTLDLNGQKIPLSSQ